MGNLLLGKRFRFFISPSGVKSRSTNIVRWVGFLHAAKPYLHALPTISMLLLPIFLQSLDNTGLRNDHNDCRWQFLPLWLSSKLWQHITYSSVGRENAINMMRNNIWMAPCESKVVRRTIFWKVAYSFLLDHRYCVLYSFFYDTEQTPFVVSGTFRAPLNERSAHARRSLIRRILDPLIAMHTLYWLAATVLLVRHLHYQFFSTNGGAAYLYTGAVVRLVEVVFAMFVPVRYMLWPPTTGQTEESAVESGHESRQAGHRYWMRREAAFLVWQDVAEVVLIIGYDWW